MRKDGANHSGYRRDRLEDDGAMAVALREEGVGTPALGLSDAEGDAIGKIAGALEQQ